MARTEAKQEKSVEERLYLKSGLVDVLELCFGEDSCSFYTPFLDNN